MFKLTILACQYFAKAAATALLSAACAFAMATVSAYELTEHWMLEGIFSMPESAVIDTERNVIYVSNVNTYAKDSNGFISRISLDGNTVELRWIEGLHSPTGMVLVDSALYVADFDALVEIDLKSASIRNRFDAPHITPSLNDVAASANGNIYVSGSASNSIYELANGKLNLWLKDDSLLDLANGLLVEGDNLISGGKTWNVFNRHAKALISDHLQPPTGTNGFDGIVSDGCGGYLYTLLDDTRIQRLSHDGRSSAASPIEFNGIDMHKVGNRLAVPLVGNSLALLNVSIEDCE